MITVEKRNAMTKTKELRRAGIIPCVIYGGALKESVSVQMEKSSANKLFNQKREGSKIKIQMDNQVIPVQIKEKTWNFLKSEIIHISFQALKADQKVNSVTHILLQNADKIAGTLEKMLLEIPYSALPADMIDTITVDLDGMPVGSALTVGDIVEFQSEKVEINVDKDSIIFRINDKKMVTEEVAAE